MQRREGRLDFDAMRLHFHQLLGEHEGARRAFHAAHSHLIVDEYQDNSEMQAKLLELMEPDGPAGHRRRRRRPVHLLLPRGTGPIELWKVATPAEQVSELVRAMRARGG